MRLWLLIALIAMIAALFLLAGVASFAQGSATPKEAQAIPGVANETPQARQLAMERYQFVQRLGHEANFTISKSFAIDDTALFPIGRSDRVYLLCVGPFRNSADDKEVPDTPSNEILCYQRKNGKDKLVYKAPLEIVWRAPAVLNPPKNLIEYITTHGMDLGYSSDNKTFGYAGSLSLAGQVTIDEFYDLTAERDYVEYEDVPPVLSLDVTLISDMRAGEKKYTEILVGQDPVTKKDWDEDQFYKRYGLPVVKEEEALIAGGKPVSGYNSIPLRS
jgi:hypothetical protein